MVYSDFTLDSITQKFELQQKIAGLFVETELILVSDWLKQSLEHGSDWLCFLVTKRLVPNLSLRQLW